MKTNCRNCKWAKWSTTSNGRRQFGNAACCTYLVVAIIPASRAQLLRDMVRPVTVHEYSDVNMSCEAWGAISIV